ncbi:FkbM family methyltransferase [Fictibacillus phosphorivorans]|uniref:FkbM family methyltransferase n=1 Tax=Fictibacillus phosphorivorans TaxID=1221500 RepID=UPI0012937F97|nr:FkbM family methyltransferase [Fictibacillus phosphorivorans]MQR94338.1 FkbM family methyltransferase [Fictibacillus phosphorivorans]
MRIVHVAPDFYPVPPLNYGGIERMIYALVEESVKRGHEVYLYAREGSATSAQLIPYHHEPGRPEHIATFVKQTLPEKIDIIHDHTHLSVIGKLKLTVPTVCTIHDSLNNDVEHPVYLSRRALEHVGKGKGYYVYNGIDLNEYPFQKEKEDYLLFLGVISAHKGIHHALEIAEKTKRRMKIAGPVFNTEYFLNEVEPRINKLPHVEYVGEVGGEYRLKLLREAACLVFPTSWEEPFGLVMVEAMACGTPVVALDNGAVSEVLNGFPTQICKNTDEMIAHLPVRYDAFGLREYVSKHFTVGHMTENYISLYKEVIQQSENQKDDERIKEHLLPAANYFKSTKEFDQAITLYERLLKSNHVEPDVKVFICNEVADIYHQRTDSEKEREYGYRSFQYDKPRAEICCRLGYSFLQDNKLDQAVFWYKRATELAVPKKKGMLYYEACWTWLPHVQLCVCYYQLGSYEKAYHHNEEARKHNPDYANLSTNKELLENVLNIHNDQTTVQVELKNENQESFLMNLHLPGFIEEIIQNNGNWEPYMMKTLKKYLNDGGTFLDVGANIGYHALHAASLNSNIDCICFEPHPKIFEQLQQNISINSFSNVSAHQLAVGNSAGHINFHMQNRNTYNRGMSAIDYYDGIGTDYTTVQVPTTTLDAFLDLETKSKVKLIKIDTQGHEYQVIQGALGLIDISQPVITLEHHNNDTKSIHDISKLLPSYEIYKVNFWNGKIARYEEESSEEFMDDYVFVPLQLKDKIC